MKIAGDLRVDVFIGDGDLEAALRRDVRAGLQRAPKDLPPKWFYDERGSLLFDEITRLPEYYPTRREREILLARAPEIARAANADTLIELGSGTSEKTRVLLDAMRDAGTLERYVPFDVSEEILRASAAAISSEYAGVDVHAIAGDFERHLNELPSGGRRVIAFLGGTIGNFEPGARAHFLREIARGMRDGDTFLLGSDLVKDTARLEAAYDDSAGVTAEFNKNVLRVINRELGADFDVERFAHVARFDLENEWIEISLRSLCDQDVSVPALGMQVHFAAGELMRTEISAKFRRDRLEAEGARAGLRLVRWWTDRNDDYALSLWERATITLP